MSNKRTSSSTHSRPLAMPPSGSSDDSRGRSPSAASNPRASSIARLASPVPSMSNQGNPPVTQIPGQSPLYSGNRSPLPGAEGSSSVPGPGHSALAAAFQGSLGRSPSRYGTPPVRFPSPHAAAPALETGTPQNTHRTIYGSFDSKSGGAGQQQDFTMPGEDPKIVKRHLVQTSKDGDETNDAAESGGRNSNRGLSHRGSELDEGEFSSLRLQGGDITREVYRYAQDAESPTQGRRGKRSKSWHLRRPQPESETENFSAIKVPGGFRRDHLRRHAACPSNCGGHSTETGVHPNLHPAPGQNFLARNFLEFLTVYGHFAGEELEEDDEDDYFATRPYLDTRYPGEDSGEEEDEGGESSTLITPRTPTKRRRKIKGQGTPGTNTRMGAALLLLKSFVGTGVLFLPRAFLNGGMLFSSLVLLGVAALSYYCFILLVNTRLEISGSFGDIGGMLYGKWMRFLILSSVALSQIGFVSAYIVFTSENMQAFVVAVSKCRTWIDIKFMVLMQLILFLPLSLIRDISKLGGTALVADAFILLGLVYLYCYDISTIVSNRGAADILSFNPQSWTLFIGTAIFTFEGVGLILPIQESMRNPAQFPPVLAGVMVIITLIFVSMGFLSYAAFGSKTKTVVLLNLPQDDKLVNAVQLLYSLAILLSTPLQLFPAIRIMESGFFSRSGKFNKYTKWKKNIFRFFLVICCALIAWGGAGDLDKFVSLVGSFACVPLVYVYPAMLHFRAVAKTRTQKIADGVLCAFGIVAMAYTTFQTINSWASSPQAIKAPGYCDG